MLGGGRGFLVGGAGSAKYSTDSSLRVTDSPCLLALLVLVCFLHVLKPLPRSGIPVYHVNMQLAAVTHSESTLNNCMGITSQID